RRPIRNPLRRLVPLGLLLRAEVRPVENLLQTADLRPLVRRLLYQPEVLLDHRLLDLGEIGRVRQRVAGLNQRGSCDAWHGQSVIRPRERRGWYSSPPMQSRKPALGFILITIALDVLGF